MTRDPQHTLFCDYLSALGVPHTCSYSNRRFAGMPFQSLFGLTKLLEEYGVQSEGYQLNDKRELAELTPPFIAATPDGFVIVTSVDDTSVSYLTQGVAETVPFDSFARVWNGTVLLSFPDRDAAEPKYALHKRLEFFNRSKKWVLTAAVALLMAYLFVVNGIYRSIWSVLLMLIDMGGIYFTYLLVQKSLKIHNPAADRVCGVLQAGGCDSILETKASKFFGLFGWSEVGFAYFSVSLITLMLLPEMLPWLALCNLCCLPFTVWSIWYQRFRAHKWCTLCVCVQGSLWLLFFCYLFGGWLKEAWPLSLNFVALGLAYLAVMLGLNALMPLIENKTEQEEDTDQ